MGKFNRGDWKMPNLQGTKLNFIKRKSIILGEITSSKNKQKNYSEYYLKRKKRMIFTALIKQFE